MPNSKTILHSLLHALGVLIYVLFVAIVMNNAENIFGQAENQFWIPAAILLLFVVSATIVGLIVLGRPAYLYLNDKKSEGIKFLFLTVGWLIVITILVFVLLASRI
ncbi:MAG: hypothetical protein Q8R08_02515 [bacterium]|nr:hypothetical protein [bacterium]